MLIEQTLDKLNAMKLGAMADACPARCAGGGPAGRPLPAHPAMNDSPRGLPGRTRGLPPVAHRPRPLPRRDDRRHRTRPRSRRRRHGAGPVPLRNERLKVDPDVQLLEDVICLVFHRALLGRLRAEARRGAPRRGAPQDVAQDVGRKGAAPPSRSACCRTCGPPVERAVASAAYGHRASAVG